MTLEKHWCAECQCYHVTEKCSKTMSEPKQFTDYIAARWRYLRNEDAFPPQARDYGVHPQMAEILDIQCELEWKDQQPRLL